MWPPLVVAACVVFLSDIFIRRVQIDLSRLKTRLASAMSRRNVVQAPATLARLSAKKAEIRERYQPPTVDAPPVNNVAVNKPVAAKAQTTKPTEPQEKPVEESMTARLLAAKKAVKDNRWKSDQ
jgi:hypothetical protein